MVLAEPTMYVWENGVGEAPPFAASTRPGGLVSNVTTTVCGMRATEAEPVR